MKGLIEWLSHALVRLAFKVKRMTGAFMGTRRLDYAGAMLFIYVENMREYNTRARSVRKEPETVAWIEAYAGESGVLYDIGANIGAYSLIAGANGLRVLAFEPSYENFRTLERNVTLNGLDRAVASYHLAFGRETKRGFFGYEEVSSGSARCTYIPAGTPIPEKYAVTKAILAFSLDDFMNTFKPPMPTLLKIDVDGGEYDIVEGAYETLRMPALRAILIEVDEGKGDAAKLARNITAAGFTETTRHARRGSAANVIFTRP